MGSDLTELSKEELIKHIEILYHNIDVDYKDKCQNYISKDKIREKIEYIQENYSEFTEYSIYKSIEFLQELLQGDNE